MTPSNNVMPPKLKSKLGTTATSIKQSSTSKGKDGGPSGISGAQSGSHSTVNCVCGSPIDSGTWLSVSLVCVGHMYSVLVFPLMRLNQSVCMPILRETPCD